MSVVINVSLIKEDIGNFNFGKNEANQYVFIIFMCFKNSSTKYIIERKA